MSLINKVMSLINYKIMSLINKMSLINYKIVSY